MPIDVTTLSKAYEFLPDPTGLVDDSGNLLFSNTAFLQIIGDNQTSQSTGSLQDIFLLRQSNTNKWQGVLNEALAEACTVEVMIAGKSKQLVCCSLHLSPIVDDGRFICFLARLTDKSVDSLPDESLTTLAYRDSLTGLANRYLFSQLFDHEISQSQRLSKRFAVLFLDLDKFKLVNDSMGHDAGDALLCAVAERLQKSLRKSDLIARMGGDEFAVIMSNIKDTETVSKVCEKLIREVKKPLRSGTNVMEVGCSIGVSIYPDNADTAESLLQHADAAMYRAKHDGGNRFQFFSDALNQELNDIRVVEQELQLGLQENQFVPYFQPVFDLRTNRVVGVECLARWQHPTRGVLAASEFISVAEKKDLIREVFNQVLTKAFEQIDHWTLSLNERIPLSINISNRQFYQHNTFDLIDSLIKQYQVPADAIRIEVTESTLQESENDLLERLTRIKTSGFSITLDDFGTGYSSLRYLQQLPVDTLKVDRSFVRNLDNNPHDKIIVKAIIQLAETLGIAVVAEGVESKLQSDFLAQNKCFIMQGYLFSQPLSSDDFETFMKTKSSPTE
ncbi:MAG: EAL domain-containing protein [Aliiglaciecola sp.]|uniref:sensor domain-containing protein n=1 Tax=Aliiglaciecola sp. TaxID=1872441 RepID=UPI003298D7B0